MLCSSSSTEKSNLSNLKISRTIMLSNHQITMFSSRIKAIYLILLCTVIYCDHEMVYHDLEALGVACPERDKCAGYRNNRSYMDRSCECDFKCSMYNDCCIDAFRRPTSTQTNMTCMHYGENSHSGVYVVSTCSSNWVGPSEVQRKCHGSPDFSDPMSAAPVTNDALSVTYKNLYCAECNNADMESLKTFQFKLSCDGLHVISQEQILGDLYYNRQTASWGVNRMNASNITSFVQCEIIFDVPSYLNRSVRFCRSNVISTCARNWTRRLVRTQCERYMAVVYDESRAYRNPHCAICNHKTVSEVTCRLSFTGRKRPMSFALLLDVNQSDGDQVGMTQVSTPQCASGHKYDPFFKKCRRLVCALPGHMVVNGRCVPGG